MTLFRKSAFDILQEEYTLSGCLKTMSKQLDLAVGYGIGIGVITEIASAPGCAKTQLCLQLSVTVQIPEELGGLDGEAIYIDTNNGFCPNRLLEISTAYIERVQTYDINDFTKDTILTKIHYAVADDYVNLVAIVKSLEKFLSTNQKVRLIIIDSFSYVFRSISQNYNDRIRIIYQLLNDLQTMATYFNCAIVITNELTTRFHGPDKSYLTPALGDSFGHRVGQRIILSHHCDNIFSAFVEKTYINPRSIILFKVTKKGIRDVE